MMNEKEFAAKLGEIRELGALQGGYITKEQLSEEFSELDKEQSDLVAEYLRKVNIGLDAPLEDSDILTDEENGYLRFYMEELQDMEVPDEDKKRVLSMGAIAGDRQAKEALIKAYLPGVVDIAKLYTGQGATLADLIGEGNVALALSVEMLGCVETPEDADALIVKMIMIAMEEYVGTEADADKTDEKALSIVETVIRSAKELSEELLRKVTVKELAAESGVSAKKIREAMRLTEECKEYITDEETQE